VDFKTSTDSHDGDTVMEAIVKARNGSVLGKRLILKIYFFLDRKRLQIMLIYFDLTACGVNLL